MKFFLPKQPIFFEEFKQLNTNIKEITNLYNEFAVNFKDFENYFVRAEEIEHKGDDTTHRIINYLNKTFITPFDREDLYILAHEMDDVIDLIARTIQTIYIYQVTEKKPYVDEFIQLAMKAAWELDKVIIECFEKQKQTPVVNGSIIKIHNLEDEGDLLFQKSIRQLFLEEKDPVQVIRWKDIYEDLEDVIDKFQKVSDIIEGIVVKSS